MGSSPWPSRKVTRPRASDFAVTTDALVVIVYLWRGLYQPHGHMARKFRTAIFGFDFPAAPLLCAHAYGKTPSIPILFRSLEHQRRPGSLRPHNPSAAAVRLEAQT